MFYVDGRQGASTAHDGFELAFEDTQSLTGDGSVRRPRVLTEKLTVQLLCNIVLASGEVGLCALKKRRLFFIIARTTRKKRGGREHPSA